MRWSDLSWKPTPGTLRFFAVQWLVFLGAVAAWQGLVHERTTVAVVLAILAVTIGPAGIWRPELIRPFYIGVMLAAFPIGWVLSRVILAIVFYGLFTPLGFLFRLRGRDLLALQPEPEKATCWVPRTPVTDPKRYFRQF